MNNNYFVPDAFMAQENTETDEVLLTFEKDDEAALRIVLSRPRLLQVVARLVELSGSQTITPISRDGLQIGASFRTVSSEFRLNPDGSLRIILGVDLEDRVVTIPIDLDSVSQKLLEQTLVSRKV